ncbi:MAG: hypothetical protein M3Y65_21955 [Pseudomonadota bacterium]|nr:hypothetical protein [Pseudomonadota bacterium]
MHRLDLARVFQHVEELRSFFNALLKSNERFSTTIGTLLQNVHRNPFTRLKNFHPGRLMALHDQFSSRIIENASASKTKQT